MDRFSWFRLCRRHFLSSTALESHIDHRNVLGSISALRRVLFQTHALGSCSLVINKPTELGVTRTSVRNRCIHATGSCCFTERDYYDILGVPKSATRDEIKKAFQVLAKKYHPGRSTNNPSVKRKFQEIRDAYETLHNFEKRAQYDKERIKRPKNIEYDTGDAEGYQFASRSHFSDSFHRIFSEIFEDEKDQVASDTQVKLTLTFAEASKGCTKLLSFDSCVLCDSCNGRGHPLDANKKICPTCKGIGKVTLPPFTSTCSTCKGFGRIIEEYCRSCRGSGVVEGVKEVKVTIPAGMESGDTIHIPEAGNAGGRGSQTGSLYIKLKVDEDSIFVRDGADIYVDSNISFTQALLGGEVEVPTLCGKMQVKIPKGVQPGQLLVLRGKGLPKHGVLLDHGDQYVRFCVNFPKAINERQCAILEELAKEEINYENRVSLEGNCGSSLFDGNE